MGRWERYLPIASLAEAAGIRDAIEAFDFSDYEGPVSLLGGDISYVCAVRGTHARKNGQTPIGPVGQLYACIYGDKYLVGGIYGYELDYVLGADDYRTYFEDIGLDLVEKAKEADPLASEAARERMTTVLNHVVSGSKVSTIVNRAIGIEERPQIAKILLMHGPATCDEIKRGVYPGNLRADWYTVLSELVKEGFLIEEYQDGKYYYSLAEGAGQMLECYEPLDIPTTPEEKIIKSLGERGSLSSADITFAIGASTTSVREHLRKLIDQNVVVAKGRGSSRRYALA